MKTKNIIFCGLFAAITAVFSQLVIPLPFSPVPFSLSLTAVFLTGALLNKKYALIAQTAYLLMGIAGVPVFSSFQSGLGILLGPTGGYLLAYPLMSFMISLTLEKSSGRSYFMNCIAMIFSLVICYSFGSIWLMFSRKVTLLSALTAGAAPFILFDTLKIALCAGLAVSMSKVKILIKN